jgi:hypothetical protein
MRRTPLLLIVALAGCGEAAARQSAPPTEHPLLSGPDPTGPTARGVYLKDPQGQVERLAASGTLVAWSVRTPADPARNVAEGPGRPRKLPASSKVVIADERGGAPLSVDLGRRWVSELRLIRGAGGPQLAVRSCSDTTERRCRHELIGLSTTTPPQVTGRTRGADAIAAVEGRLDGGRSISATGRACRARLSVREPDGRTRALPRLPRHDREYTRCSALVNVLIRGPYAFASVWREAAKLSFDAEFFYALDLTGAPRWVEIARPFHGTDGGSALGIGPALTDQALFWQTYDTVEELIYSLDRAALPPRADGATMSDPIAPDAGAVCAIAATDAAVYELANPRCAYGYADGRSGEIRRVVNPTWRPYEG